MSKSKKRDIPKFSSPILESHCHLDYLKDEGIDEVLDRAGQVGVERTITIATEPDNLQTVLDIANQRPQVFCTQGIHPHEAKLVSESVLKTIKHNAQTQDKVLAVGEIGLDYYYQHSERDVQLKAFEQQLQIACDLDLPVVIHTREADDDTQGVLKQFSSHLAKKGVIHSFTSSLALAEFCLQEGFALGFNGIISFNRADNVREVLAATPLDRILMETDAPYLTPVPYRGKQNEPQYLPFIAEKIAEVKGVEVEALLPQIYQNTVAVFGEGLVQ